MQARGNRRRALRTPGHPRHARVRRAGRVDSERPVRLRQPRAPVATSIRSLDPRCQPASRPTPPAPPREVPLCIQMRQDERGSSLPVVASGACLCPARCHDGCGRCGRPVALVAICRLSFRSDRSPPQPWPTAAAGTGRASLSVGPARRMLRRPVAAAAASGCWSSRGRSGSMPGRGSLGAAGRPDLARLSSRMANIEARASTGGVRPGRFARSSRGAGVAACGQPSHPEPVPLGLAAAAKVRERAAIRDR